MERIITYDLRYADTDDYEDLYAVLEELNGKKLTESTYVINTSLNQQTIIKKIKDVIYPDDVVYYVSVDFESNKLFYKKIN